jgi:hypothetical protein
LLLIVPWTVFWERNFFLEHTLLGELLRQHAIRGAISGLGVVCLGAALAELWALRPRRLAKAGEDAVVADRPLDASRDGRGLRS